MPAERKYDAAMFDLDGTLLDTLEDLADAMNAALAELQLPTHPLEAHGGFVGEGVHPYVVRSLPADRRDDARLIERLTGIYRATYSAGWSRKTRPYDGIAEMLDALLRRNVRLTVLSNKPEDFTCKMVSHYFRDVPFEIVRGARTDMPLKPDPAAALDMIGRMGLQPARLVYLGDTATDMQTGLAAGMFTVGALWGFRPRQELEENGAQALIAEPAELLELIQ